MSRPVGIQERLPGKEPAAAVARAIALSVSELLRSGQRQLVHDAISAGYLDALAKGATLGQVVGTEDQGAPPS